ncbi:hypothetical protein A7A76_16470 [Lysobacter enzymogenes]|uniref:hypothetical protein n=1 Tax=Lysobacter enzymogenes TaxID=69 RepID=UPI0019D0B9A0|nr:hypothetical protein [Lysobacter enzymogenes]MBN7136338.1 hypothetical protein [Lysobacter enzymogenes]
MIVYRFGPHSADELTVWFDMAGAETMLCALNALATSEQDETSEELHATRLLEASAAPARIVLARSAQDAMVKSDAAVRLSMADETVDYAVIKLRDFLGSRDFSPAEFAAFVREGRKYDTQVYFCRLDEQTALRAGG